MVISPDVPGTLAHHISERMAAARCGRRLDHRCGRHPQSHGVCHHRRPAGAGGSIHGLSTDGDLRRAGHFTRTQREHDDYARDSGRSRVGRGGSERRPGFTAGRLRHADFAGWSDARARFHPAAGLRCQLHLRAGPDWFQGRHRSRHRAGPDSRRSSGSTLPGVRSSRTCLRLSTAFPRRRSRHWPSESP